MLWRSSREFQISSFPLLNLKRNHPQVFCRLDFALDVDIASFHLVHRKPKHSRGLDGRDIVLQSKPEHVHIEKVQSEKEFLLRDLSAIGICRWHPGDDLGRNSKVIGKLVNL